MTIEELFEAHPVLAIDSDVLIRLMDGEGPRAEVAHAVASGIEDGRAVGILASIGVVEVLAGPASWGDDVLEGAREGLLGLPGLRVLPLDTDTAVDAARLRAGGIGLAEAIHLATARRAGAGCLLTDDRRMPSAAGVEVVLLSSITVGEDVPEEAAPPPPGWMSDEAHPDTLVRDDTVTDDVPEGPEPALATTDDAPVATPAATPSDGTDTGFIWVPASEDDAPL